MDSVQNRSVTATDFLLRFGSPPGCGSEPVVVVGSTPSKFDVPRNYGEHTIDVQSRHRVLTNPIVGEVRK
jgi:hypothetical protein